VIPTNGERRIPEEMWQAMQPHLEGLGMVPPDMANRVPKIHIDTPVRKLGMQLGQLLRRSGLFRYGPEKKLVIFEENERVPMTAVRFCSFVEQHVTVVKTSVGRGGGTYESEVSMGKDLAAKVLETSEFLRELPRIDSMVSTRVPVRRSGTIVELCKKGWDEEARLYCTDEVVFPQDWTVERAKAYLEGLCGEFLWADLAPNELWRNRSFLVHVAAMVGVFARKLLPPGTVRPLIIYSANDQGSGKSLLVSMVLAACFGMAASTDLPIGGKGLNQEKLTALLETVAQSLREFLFLDDVPQNVFSNAMNRFVTAPSHSARKYGGNDEMFDVPAVTQVFMTGPNMELTRDLMQRALFAELFLPMDSQTRKFKHRMTADWLAERPQREGLQAAMWAFVRNWIEKGMPMSERVQGRAPRWSALVGGIMEAAGIEDDPFAVPNLPMGGDRETEEWRELLTAVADELEEPVFEADDDGKPREVSTSDLVRVARERRLLVDLVGAEDDKPLKGGELRKLGRRLAKWRGREDLRTTKGTRFRFGKRKQASNWVYPVEWLD
jgi:hypothetical protein